ncbi:MAG: transglycosylase domain-containing protein, partial [Vagococcus sp.]|nr:transglycosylase domain-containing protein [Vagococcus sp.]
MSEKTRSYTQGQKRKNKKKPKQNKKKWIGRILLILFLVVSIAFLSGVGLFLFYAKGAPELDVAKLEDTLSSKVYDRNDQLIYEVGEKKRETVAPEQVPFQLKEAIMSIEDKRFEKHIGVDPIRIVGAAISNLTSDSLQGGSTLTQQLIKLSYFSTKEEDQTLKRKAQEASLAIELERSKTKDEILTYYINKVYMSNGLYGMETASEIYFGKSLDQLTLAQTALLAGLPQAPATYDPYVNPDLAKKRRDIVLGEMKRDNRINEEEYQAAINESIEESLRPLENQSESYRMIDNYIKEVIAEAKEKSEKDIYTDGLEIHTNLDLDAQSYLYNLVNGDEQIQFPNDDFQAAITILDVHTGDVIAQIGGRKVPEDVQLGEN